MMHYLTDNKQQPMHTHPWLAWGCHFQK